MFKLKFASTKEKEQSNDLIWERSGKDGKTENIENLRLPRLHGGSVGDTSTC